MFEELEDAFSGSCKAAKPCHMRCAQSRRRFILNSFTCMVPKRVATARSPAGRAQHCHRLGCSPTYLAISRLGRHEMEATKELFAYNMYILYSEHVANVYEHVTVKALRYT